MDKNEIDYKRAAEQLRKGEPLFGKDGALALMLERILNAALEGEMDAHLSIDERSKGNLHNGKLPKQVQTCYGEFTVETPRDRDGSFEPQTIKKRKTILSVNLIPDYLQKPSVPSQTEYCLKSSHGVHECLILYMQYAALTV